MDGHIKFMVSMVRSSGGSWKVGLELSNRKRCCLKLGVWLGQTTENVWGKKQEGQYEDSQNSCLYREVEETEPIKKAGVRGWRRVRRV